MKSDELKASIPMEEVLRKYGISVRGNMCRCPFHGKDRHPSMKVFKDGANCFTCGWNGDIFKFVQEMEHITFSEAFLLLGGTYEKHSDASAKLLEYKRKKEEEKREKLAAERRAMSLRLLGALNIVQAVIRIYEPYEDKWCEAQNELPIILDLWERNLDGEEIDENYAVKRCAEIQRKFLA